ncbi:MAG: DUF2007 domain-containing protein [Amylibacter sp.]
MKELFRTTDPTLIPFATAMLRAEDIECFDLDVHMSILEGSIGIMPRRLMVADRDYFQASAILRDNDVDISEKP